MGMTLEEPVCVCVCVCVCVIACPNSGREDLSSHSYLPQSLLVVQHDITRTVR